MDHKSVLLREVVELVRLPVGGVYVDGTLGRAGHALAILQAAGEGATLLGIDRDATAIKESAERLQGVKAKVQLVQAEHSRIEEVVREQGLVGKVDAVLLDLGVSSPQLDDASRGFSFLKEGPLDMRMNLTQGETAAELVARLSEEELRRVLWEYGEERQSGRVARAIVQARVVKPIVTTTQLAAVVERAIGRHGAHHPATKTFQALRMAVNEEVQELERALTGALAVLKPGGRLVVITFESITDRMVKRFFVSHTPREVALEAGGVRREVTLPAVKTLTRHAVTASAAEVAANPRSRSAKVRAVELLDE